MIYLLFTDGAIAELPAAISVTSDTTTGEALCLGDDGTVVAKYPNSRILSFNNTPFNDELIRIFRESARHGIAPQQPRLEPLMPEGGLYG